MRPSGKQAPCLPPDLRTRDFRPSWICRADVDVVVMRPAVGFSTPPELNTVVSGSPRLVWFKALNTSNLNWVW